MKFVIPYRDEVGAFFQNINHDLQFSVAMQHLTMELSRKVEQFAISLAYLYYVI